MKEQAKSGPGESNRVTAEFLEETIAPDSPILTARADRQDHPQILRGSSWRPLDEFAALSTDLSNIAKTFCDTKSRF